MLFTKVASLTIFVGSAVAQLNATRLEDGGASIDARTKASWCIGQRSACDILCDKSALVNDCKPDLTWNCECNDGQSPKDLAEYKDTIPFHICQASFAACIKANPDDALGQTDCTENIEKKCATKDIANYTGSAETTTTESVASSTATDVAAGTTSGASPTEDAAPSGTEGGAPAASTTEAAGNDASGLKGSVVLVGAALAAFGFML